MEQLGFDFASSASAAAKPVKPAVDMVQVYWWAAYGGKDGYGTWWSALPDERKEWWADQYRHAYAARTPEGKLLPPPHDRDHSNYSYTFNRTLAVRLAMQIKDGADPDTLEVPTGKQWVIQWGKNWAGVSTVK